MEKKALVYYKTKLAGILKKEDIGYTFTYHKDYLQDPHAIPISLSFPLGENKYESSELFPFFDGLLPEGWLLRLTCSAAKIDEEDRFGLLLHTGQDPVGAVSVVPWEEEEKK